MWPAKLSGEGFAMYEACKGLCDLMKLVGVAADGGKDSLSMAAHTVNEDNTVDDTVKAPGTVVVSAYAPCVDITKVLDSLTAVYFVLKGRLEILLHVFLIANFATMSNRSLLK